MDDFVYQDGQLHCEQVNLDDLVARVGTPVYVYSQRTFQQHYDRMAEAFAPIDPLICFSIKSCGNIQICKMLADRGAGMDVVSGGELYRAQKSSVAMNKVVYAGVGKTDVEIRDALAAKIGYFNIESEAEFENIATIAKQMGTTAQAALRVNPDVADPKTHAKTTTGAKETKFGVDLERAIRFFETYGHNQHLQLTAIHLHIGSPIYSAEPYVRAIKKAMILIEDLRQKGFHVTALDIGGGYAADYETGRSPSAAGYAKDIVPLLKGFHRDGGKIILEPGRSIAGNAGVLLTRVLYLKFGGKKKFVIVDAGMSNLIRVAMYDSFHFIWPTNVVPAHVPTNRSQHMAMDGLEPCDVVGPICETGDLLAKQRPLPPVARDDLLCIFTAGAYGMVMASNYNAMPRPAEVMISGHHATIVRRRETYEDLVSTELEVQPI